MKDIIQYKRKNWFRAVPLRDRAIFNSVIDGGLEFELDKTDVLSVRGEKGNQYLAYTETGIMLRGYVDKNYVRKLSKEEADKVDLVMVKPLVSGKW